MENKTKGLKPKLAFLLCLSILLLTDTRFVQAQNRSQISVQVGQPSIWSLSQAHYLLAAMRDRSHGIGTKVPLPTDLDPNSANGARLNVLRTMISASADFNGVAGSQNDMFKRKFDTEFATYSAAQSRINELMVPYTAAVSEVASLTVQRDALADNAANADQRKQSTAQLADKTAERDKLKAELDEMRKVTISTTPTLVPNSASSGNSGSGLPDDLKSVFDALVKGSTTPRLDATTVLDNYIQMQYEVIAKQLTLLRDEVGPSERLVFLELPMSVYSVPKQDDDYLVRLEWNVTSFYGPSGEPESVLAERPTSMPRLSINETRTESLNADLDVNAQEESQTESTREREVQTDERSTGAEQLQPLKLSNLISNTDPHESLSQATCVRTPAPLSQLMRWAPAEGTQYRVVDIIPRQSALNINDMQGTQKGLALTAKFLTVFGFGGQVGYQRQRSVYEQFMQQEVYASAFGKGLNNFGWTFGSLPGTRRIAPGVRTTYAVLAVPNDALAMELNVQAKVYRRDRSPSDATVKPLPQVNNGTFRILIPSEQTEGFWVDSVTYTPVEKGKQTTMIIEGKYFSPLTGILVNGVPVTRVISIARNETSSTSEGSAASNQNNTGPVGEYEYLNPQQLILSLKMDANYVGTPLITLVTPEKTSAINFFRLDKINGIRFDRCHKESLSQFSESEPMFTEPFHLGSVEVTNDLEARHVTVLIHGSGFHRGARFFIGTREVHNGIGQESIRFLGTDLYELKFRRPEGGRPVSIRYRNTSKQAVQENTLTFQQNVVSDYDILRYQPVGRNLARLDLTLTITGQDATPEIEIDRNDGRILAGPNPLGANKYRIQLLAKHDPVSLSVTSVAGVTRIFDIGLPVAPSIDSVVNATTGKAEGPASKNVVVTLRGSNFQHVTRVLFGTKVANIMQVDPTVILVSAPTGDEGPVQILLETNVNLAGKTVSNIADFRIQGKATYTYTK
jgi:hypothetical protein